MSGKKPAGHRVVDIVSWKHLEAVLGWRRDRVRALAETSGRFWRPFDFRHFGAEKWRHVDIPTGELRALHKAIQSKILRRVPMPEYVIGGVSGRSITDNAAMHARQQVVVTLDLRDCFPNIRHTDVFAALRDELRYAEDIASALTKITTYHGRVPQGASTSTMVANLALLPLHRALEAYAVEAGLNFSVWVDDLTFSGRAPELHIDNLIEVIHGYDYAISRRKISVFRRPKSAQRVTGLTTNHGVSVGREMIQKIASDIARWEHQEPGERDRASTIRGRIAFVGHVRPSQAVRLNRIAEARLHADDDHVARERMQWRRCSKSARNHRHHQGRRRQRSLPRPPDPAGIPSTGHRREDPFGGQARRPHDRESPVRSNLLANAEDPTFDCSST